METVVASLWTPADTNVVYLGMVLIQDLFINQQMAELLSQR
jgi:hypothetical protein